MSNEPPPKPERIQEKWGIPRVHWLPICAFAGGALIFLLVDLLCYLASASSSPPISR